jgi:hypothetical protein
VDDHREEFEEEKRGAHRGQVKCLVLALDLSSWTSWVSLADGATTINRPIIGRVLPVHLEPRSDEFLVREKEKP